MVLQTSQLLLMHLNHDVKGWLSCSFSVLLLRLQEKMLVPIQTAKDWEIDEQKVNLMLPSVAFSFKATKQQQNDTRRTAICISVAIQTTGALQRSAGSFIQYSTGIPASSVLSFLQPLVCFRWVTTGHFHLKPFLWTKLTSQEWLCILHSLNWITVNLKVHCRHSEIVYSLECRH